MWKKIKWIRDKTCPEKQGRNPNQFIWCKCILLINSSEALFSQTQNCLVQLQRQIRIQTEEKHCPGKLHIFVDIITAPTVNFIQKIQVAYSICHTVRVVTKYWPGRPRSWLFAALCGAAYSRQGLLWLQANAMTLSNCPRIWATAQNQKAKHNSPETIIKNLFFLAEKSSHGLLKSAYIWESSDALIWFPGRQMETRDSSSTVVLQSKISCYLQSLRPSWTRSPCTTQTLWQPEKFRVIEFDKGEQSKITPKHKWLKAKPPVSTQSGFQHFCTVSSGKHTGKSVPSLSWKGWLRTLLPQQQ